MRKAETYRAARRNKAFERANNGNWQRIYRKRAEKQFRLVSAITNKMRSVVQDHVFKITKP